MTDPISALHRLVEEERLGARVALMTGTQAGTMAVIDAEEGLVAGSLPGAQAEAILADAHELMSRHLNRALTYGVEEIFIETLVPPPHLIIFGAVHIAQLLTTLAHNLGYRVTVSDARPAFCTKERFPLADRLAVGWPDQVELVFDRRTSVVVLSHDARFEDPLWPLVLPSPAPYIGAMGSKRTAARRRERLLRQGYLPEQVDRIHGPIGLDIGAEDPGEVAVAILAEMVASRARPGDPPRLHGLARPL